MPVDVAATVVFVATTQYSSEWLQLEISHFTPIDDFDKPGACFAFLDGYKLAVQSR